MKENFNLEKSASDRIVYYRRQLLSSEVRKVAELDLSDSPVLNICREMFMAQRQADFKFDKMKRKAKKLGENCGNLAGFLAINKNAYVSGMSEILEMAGVNGASIGYIADGKRMDLVTLIHVTPDIGYYSHLAKNNLRRTLILRNKVRKLENLFADSGNESFITGIRNYLTDEELGLVEELDVYSKHPELYHVQRLFLESCDSLTTVNRRVSRSLYIYEAPEYKRYTDNEVYLRDLLKLLDCAGIKVSKVSGNLYMVSKDDSDDVEILEITPCLGRNTFIHEELAPRSWK